MKMKNREPRTENRAKALRSVGFAARECYISLSPSLDSVLVWLGRTDCVGGKPPFGRDPEPNHFVGSRLSVLFL
jgi:hypothetical protein